MATALAVTLAGCGQASPEAESSDKAPAQATGPSPRDTASKPAPSPTPAKPKTTTFSILGYHDGHHPPGSGRAVTMCQEVVGGGRLESAFLTRVGQIRSGPAPFPAESDPPGRLWPSVEDAAPAAWCSVRTGQMLTVGAVAAGQPLVVWFKASHPLNPGPGDPPPPG